MRSSIFSKRRAGGLGSAICAASAARTAPAIGSYCCAPARAAAGISSGAATVAPPATRKRRRETSFVCIGPPQLRLHERKSVGNRNRRRLQRAAIDVFDIAFLQPTLADRDPVRNSDQ